VAARSMPVIGVLDPRSSTPLYAKALVIGLQELGYVDGQNIRLEYRSAEGDFDKLSALAEELVHLNVDVIVAFATQASLAAKKATATIPIVMVGVGDPIGAGLITSLAHPEGNVTGNSSIAVDIIGKQLEFLKEIVPNLSRAVTLWNPANTVFQALQTKAAEAAAMKAGVQLQLVEVRAPAEFDSVFEVIDRQGVRTLLILADPLFSSHADALAKLSMKYRLISISAAREFANAGVLMAYGPNYLEMYKQAARYVDKIIKGARPAELPVEQPTKFEFVINNKTAKTLGLQVPDKLFALADEVIE